MYGENWSSDILAIGTKKLAKGMNNEVEAQAALLGIKMANKLAVSKLHLEGHS